MFLSKPGFTVCAFAGCAALAACATQQQQEQQPKARDGWAPRDVAMQWAGNGYFGPDAAGDMELIGMFETEAACEEAINDWMTRQVVGAPVSAECLPIDRD